MWVLSMNKRSDGPNDANSSTGDLLNFLGKQGSTSGNERTFGKSKWVDARHRGHPASFRLVGACCSKHAKSGNSTANLDNFFWLQKTNHRIKCLGFYISVSEAKPLRDRLLKKGIAGVFSLIRQAHLLQVAFLLSKVCRNTWQFGLLGPNRLVSLKFNYVRGLWRKCAGKIETPHRTPSLCRPNMNGLNFSFARLLIATMASLIRRISVQPSRWCRSD